MEAQTYRAHTNPSFIGLIGISQNDITPPGRIHTRNWGAAKHDQAEGIHMPLVLVCQTFQSSSEDLPLILISADLGWWKNSDDELFLRHGILNELSLQPWQLMICLSHTHAGPSICRQDVVKPGGEFVEPYLLQIQQTAVNAIKEALANATRATLTWAYGKCGLAANRDLPELGKDRIAVGFNPEAEPDDTLLVGRITDEQGVIIGTTINYACHPTTLAWDNRLISPDYVGEMRKIVVGKTQAPCLFLQGASGELAPAEQYVGDVTLAERYGRQLGYAVLASLESMLLPQTQLAFNKIVESGAPLAVWKQSFIKPSDIISFKMIDVEFPLKSLPSLHEIQLQLDTCKDRVLQERLSRKLNIRKAVGDGHYARIPVWIWRLGDSFLVGQPNEAYSDLQIQLRKDFLPHAVAVMNVVNGHIGYLPPTQLYELDIYSVWQTPFEKGSLELLIETIKNSIRQILNE